MGVVHTDEEKDDLSIMHPHGADSNIPPVVLLSITILSASPWSPQPPQDLWTRRIQRLPRQGVELHFPPSPPNPELCSRLGGITYRSVMYNM